MTKSIKIPGKGCPKCQTLTAVVTDVSAENHIYATIEKVQDVMAIMTYTVMMTPTLVIDDEVTIKGRVPSKGKVLALLQQG